MSDFANNVTAISALVTSGAVLISTMVNARRIKDVKHEVKTGNSQTLAQLADAVETRRVDKIPQKNRTRTERSHIKEADKTR